MPTFRKHLAVKASVYGHPHIFQLLVGHDFFHDGFGRDMDAMRAAWADPAIRRQVYDLAEQRRLAGRGTRAVPWAAETFGD